MQQLKNTIINYPLIVFTINISNTSALDLIYVPKKLHTSTIYINLIDYKYHAPFVFTLIVVSIFKQNLNHL